MKKLFIYISILIIGIAVGLYLSSETNTLEEVGTQQQEESETESTQKKYDDIELATNATATLYCQKDANYLGCSSLYLVDNNTSEKTSLEIPTVGANWDIHIAPNENRVLIVFIDEIYLVDLTVQASRRVLETDENQMFGIYSEEPSFVSKVAWIDNATIRIPYYDRPSAHDDTPREIKEIKI